MRAAGRLPPPLAATPLSLQRPFGSLFAVAPFLQPPRRDPVARRDLVALPGRRDTTLQAPSAWPMLSVYAFVLRVVSSCVAIS
jgi:hypothetical protein